MSELPHEWKLRELPSLAWSELLAVVGGSAENLVDGDEEELLRQMGVTATELLTEERVELNIKGLDERHAALVGTALGFGASVTHLVLSGNKIGDPGATAIANAIAVNASLKTLGCARFLTKPS